MWEARKQCMLINACERIRNKNPGKIPCTVFPSAIVWRAIHNIQRWWHNNWIADESSEKVAFPEIYAKVANNPQRK